MEGMDKKREGLVHSPDFRRHTTVYSTTKDPQKRAPSLKGMVLEIGASLQKFYNLSGFTGIFVTLKILGPRIKANVWCGWQVTNTDWVLQL